MPKKKKENPTKIEPALTKEEVNVVPVLGLQEVNNLKSGDFIPLDVEKTYFVRYENNKIKDAIKINDILQLIGV